MFRDHSISDSKLGAKFPRTKTTKNIRYLIDHIENLNLDQKMLNL